MCFWVWLLASVAVGVAVGVVVARVSWPAIAATCPRLDDSPLGLPWKLVIETCVARLGAQRFGTLVEYQQAFVDFCGSDHPLFSPALEAGDLKQMVSAFWRYQLLPIFAEFVEDAREWDNHAWDAVREMLRRDVEAWPSELMPGFDEGFGRVVLEAYAAQVDELREHWFDGELPPEGVRMGLLGTIERLFTRDVIGAVLASGIVFVGCGQTGSIQVFAQPDMVNAFILGIPRRMQEPLYERIEGAAREVLQRANVSEELLATIDVAAEAEAATNAFFGMLHLWAGRFGWRSSPSSAGCSGRTGPSERSRRA